MSFLMTKVVDKVVEERERSARVNGYFNDPAAWAEYMLGVKLWSKQREIAESVVHNKNVAVKAGHGVGKSFLVAVLACWWVDTRYPDVRVATTAPSVQQIGAIVWNEIRKMKALIERRYKEGKVDHILPGNINSDLKDNQWKGADGQSIAFGKKPPENKEDDAFQGIHDGGVLAIGDEACGLSNEIIDALSNITSNEGSRRILIANPTNPASYFASLFREDKGWTLHTISVFDSPNFTDEKYEMTAEALEKLSGPTYAEDKAKEYGIDSARYKARVLGEFAFDMGNSLITEPDLAIGWDTVIVPSTDTRPVLGVDVARMGEDKTVIYKNHDGHVRYYNSWGKQDSIQTANEIHKAAMETGAAEVRIDASGMGGPICDQVVALSEGAYSVIQMIGQASSPDRRKWHNARAHWYDEFRRRVRSGEFDFPNADEDDTVNDELMSIEYKFFPYGGLLIESKDDMRKRGMKSPDHADALIYACADMSHLFSNPLANLVNGQQIVMDMSQFEENWANVLAW